MPNSVGPVLFARRSNHSLYHVSALMVLPVGAPPSLRVMGGPEIEPVELVSMLDRVVWRYDFALPASDRAFYQLGDQRFPVAADLTQDLRVAYVSCNGQEQGDDGRSLDERNLMWRRLSEDHKHAPLSLMLHGGDQLYADEVLDAHPVLQAWKSCSDDEKPAHVFSDEVKMAAEAYLFQRYLSLYSQPWIADLLATAPSLMMWDDHDIIDGWGSHSDSLLDSPVGKGVFQAARTMFMLFQQAVTEDHPRDPAEHSRRSLGFAAAFPGFDILAPDLRSERRPDRIMDQDGWFVVTKALSRKCHAKRLFLMSSVPLLGPRLSWIEALIGFVPKLRRYEDDLRDQWQSHAHRGEWTRFLSLITETIGERELDLTVLSGEIHLATRAEMELGGAKSLNQLVASGIAHPPPPRLYARALGGLAAFGESPLPGQRIRIKRLPGQRRLYVAERNYLILEREGDCWTAFWELEESGRTSPLVI